MKSPWQTIKQAYLSLVTDDSSAYPKGQAGYNDKTTDFLRYSPYGLDSNPPLNSWVLLLGSQGQEAVKIGLISDLLNRKKELKEGEAVLYNTLTKSFVLLKENGDIEVDAKNDLIATVAGNMAADVGGNASVNAGGNASVTAINITLTATGAVVLTAAGTVTITGSTVIINSKPFLSHVHTNVTVGFANSGPVA